MGSLNACCKFALIFAFVVLIMLLQVSNAVEATHDRHNYTGGLDGDDDGGFVSRRGPHFMLKGSPLYVNGFNAYYLSYAAVDSKETVARILQQAARMGLTLCRTWAFNDGARYHALQVSPGFYDESSFQALDYVLHEARLKGLRLILSLTDNYANMGGKQQYIQWARDAGVPSDDLSSEDDFFTHPAVKSYYKNHVKAILTRLNTFTGVQYKDDPTVFAWELMNEPRCPSDPSGDTLHAWIEEMALYVKSIDAKHMVEVGLEGFYGPTSPEKQGEINPWGVHLQTGTDYIRSSQIEAIDFTTVHSYPDMWLAGWSFPMQLQFLKKWVTSHINDGEAVGKPMLFTEFGLSQQARQEEEEEGWEHNRHALFSLVYRKVYSSAMDGGAAAGALMWQVCPWELQGTMGTDGYSISLDSTSPNSSIMALILQQSQKLSSLSNA